MKLPFYFFSLTFWSFFWPLVGNAQESTGALTSANSSEQSSLQTTKNTKEAAEEGVQKEPSEAPAAAFDSKEVKRKEPAPSSESPPSSLSKPRNARSAPAEPPRWHWDANIDLGLGSTLGSTSSLSLFGRARGGITRILDIHFLTVGATYKYSSLSSATLGLQGEYLHLGSGFWIQAGFGYDIPEKKPEVTASLGWSLIGVELEQRGFDTTSSTALYGKIRIPVGILALALEK